MVDVLDLKYHVDFPSCPLQISTALLLHLNGLKEGLKVTCTKALMVLALNNFNKESGPVFNGFGKDLKKVAAFVIVDENVEFGKDIQVLRYLCRGGFQAEFQVFVVSGGNLVCVSDTG